MTNDRPYSVEPEECPHCGNEPGTVYWPGDNPDSVDIRCPHPECQELITVPRKGDWVKTNWREWD